MTTSIEEMNNKAVGLKADIFDLMRQAEYLVNLKNQKIQELNALEENIRQANVVKQEVAKQETIKQIEKPQTVKVTEVPIEKK